MTGTNSGLPISHLETVLSSAGKTGRFELGRFVVQQKRSEPPTSDRLCDPGVQQITSIRAQSLLAPAREIRDLKLVEFYLEQGADVNPPSTMSRSCPCARHCKVSMATFTRETITADRCRASAIPQKKFIQASFPYEPPHSTSIAMWLPS